MYCMTLNKHIQIKSNHECTGQNTKIFTKPAEGIYFITHVRAKYTAGVITSKQLLFHKY